MANSQFKTTCQELRYQGFSLNEIIGATGKPKTSVYFHIKKIPLSPTRREDFIRASTKRIIAHNRSRKGVSVGAFIPFDAWTPNIVSLLAHLRFDGNIRYYGCTYYNRNNALIDHVRICFSDIYTYPPVVGSWKDVARISYNNVALTGYLHSKANALFNDITQLPLELKRSFS